MWSLYGVEYAENPRFTTPRVFVHIVRLWRRCSGGMGGTPVLPEPGGVNQQAAWLMTAFTILDAEEARLGDLERDQR